MLYVCTWVSTVVLAYTAFLPATSCLLNSQEMVTTTDCRFTIDVQQHFYWPLAFRPQFVVSLSAIYNNLHINSTCDIPCMGGNISKTGDIRQFAFCHDMNGPYLYHNELNLLPNSTYQVKMDFWDPANISVLSYSTSVATADLYIINDNDLSSTPKEITTPGWPVSYPNNSMVLWNLTADDGFKVQFTLHEGDSEPPYDSLVVFETITNQYWPQLMYSVGNVSRPIQVISNLTNVIVSFYSDPFVSKKGYRMSYIQTDGSNTTEVHTTAPGTTQFTPPAVKVIGTGGNRLIHIDLRTIYYDYRITFNGISVNVTGVLFHVIQGLENDQNYEIPVEVQFEENTIESLTLTVKTSSLCTLTCLNAVCALDNGIEPGCKCRPGYEKHSNVSNGCVDVDECIRNRCPVNSVCSNTVGSFVCRCHSGYKLINGVCEVINLCKITNPCQNEGSCIPVANSFMCQCRQYFSGKTCATYVSPCISRPCANRGICNDLFGSFTCSCTPYFTGARCQLDVDECQPYSGSGSGCGTSEEGCEANVNPCKPNSLCTNFHGGYNCTCDEGYRGDGKVKCYEIILLPYGQDVGDELLPIYYNAMSPQIHVPFPMPFGRQSFSSLYVTSNGQITLGSESWWAGYLYRPDYNGFGYYKIPLIAPFWDNFHPSRNNKGRVYYQVYNQLKTTLTLSSKSIVDEVDQRIAKFSGKSNFTSLFVLKATWHEVVMYYEYYNRAYPSTFQAIVATDGEDTYAIFNYKEDAMLWNTDKRWYWGNRALIGYTNGKELEYIETQGDYRPDKRPQNNGTTPGQYFYQLTPSFSKDVISNARKSCLNWYIRDSDSGWEPDREPCPCTAIQAFSDRRFTSSVETYLSTIKAYSSYDWWSWWRYVDGSNISLDEWSYEEDCSGSDSSTDTCVNASRHISAVFVLLLNEYTNTAQYGRCMQMRTEKGPRCCYGSRRNFFNRWWGWWNDGPLLQGPLASRYERYQIPIVETTSWSWRWGWNFIYYREQSRFDQQYQNALEYDLIPRRQCCIESESTYHCNLYKERRPSANCDGYIQRWPSWTFGDPHISTSDGNTYTFNGEGEYYYLYAPDVFTIQARIVKATKDDGSEAGGTIFVAFAVKDHTSNESGTVQFEVDPSNLNGTGIIVRINGARIDNITSTEMEYSQVSMSLKDGAYQATFPSTSALSVSASDFMLSVQFTGDTATLHNVSKGLLGAWNGIKNDDFEMRNGTVLEWSSLQPTENLDILNGTLLEEKLYPFGLSWQITESESIFAYTGGEDTYAAHNPTPTSEPPFLEVLVREQRAESHFSSVLANCTTNGVVSTTCLYDVLVTNRTEIGQSTLSDADTSASVAASNSNTPPNITIEGSSIENGDTFLAELGVHSTFTVIADDTDSDSVTFEISTNNSVPGITIDPSTGAVSWTPSEENRITSITNQTLTIQAIDSDGGEAVLTVNIKLCVCVNGGVCLYNETLVGTENYRIVSCSCSEAYSGDDCSDDRNGCLLSACYANVTCTDNPAPQTGESCGPCPEGTTGDGRNCTNIDLCESNPCDHICETLYNDFTCSCDNGYLLSSDNASCDDIDECKQMTTCSEKSSSVCNNTEGSFICYCPDGFRDHGDSCNDIDECEERTFSCPDTATTCFNKPGSYGCACNDSYSRAPDADDQSVCTDIDECALHLHTCDTSTQVCRNKQPGYACDCKSGFHLINDVCDDIRECENDALNDCTAPNMVCLEEEGSYRCDCSSGYQLNAANCQDINECLSSGICPTNTKCENRDGGYSCLCDPNFACGVNPYVNAPTVLSKTKNCVTILLDDASLYGSYEVRAISDQHTVMIDSTSIKTQICGLFPNTEYSITVRVLSLKNSSQIFLSTEHSASALTKTDAVKSRLSLRILSESYTSEMSDITSTAALDVRNRHESNLLGKLIFTIEGSSITALNVIFIRLTAGSVVVSAESELETQIDSVLASADGSQVDPTVYADLVTIANPPNPPANLKVTSVTNTSISVAYDPVTSAVQYELQLTCPNITRSEVTTETSYTFSNLPPNTICSVQVRVLATVGSTTSARSDFSASVETTSLPAVTGLRATSINETSVVIVFNFVKRAVSYTVQSSTNITMLTQNNVVSGVLSLPVEGLSRSTTYTYFVVVVATDVDGKQHESEPAKLVFTTDGLCRVNLCLNGGICYENQGVSGCHCLSGFTGTLCENSDIDLTLLLGLVIPACVILLGALIVLILRQYNKKNKKVMHLQGKRNEIEMD